MQNTSSSQKSPRAANDTDTLQQFAHAVDNALRNGISRETVRDITRSLRHSVKFTRHGVTISGRGVADVLLYIAPRLPVRSREALVSRYGQRDADALSREVVSSATRLSAGVGGATGALASVTILSPPTWLALPVEVLVETVLIAAVEIRMIGELYNIYGMSLDESEEARAQHLLDVWSKRKNIDLAALGSVGPALTASGAKAALMRSIRRRILARATRNVSTLIPFLVGAALGAEMNRRSTKSLGADLRKQLAAQRPR